MVSNEASAKMNTYLYDIIIYLLLVLRIAAECGRQWQYTYLAQVRRTERTDKNNQGNNKSIH
jgi:YD repeat-containing protein